MSMLGYSASYFLPSYWSTTPLYGEKIIPLLDYIMSNDYEYSEQLSQAFYDIENKYKNVQDLPIEKIIAIIDECGYSYIRELLGDNEESIRLLVSLVGLIHFLKGQKIGIQVVLNLLKKDNDLMTMSIIGNPTIKGNKEITNISTNDYILYKGFIANSNEVEVKFNFTTNSFNNEQTLISVSDYGIIIGIDTEGRLTLSLSSNRMSWNIANKIQSNKKLILGKSYFVKFQYDGYEYSLQVSEDGKKYETWIGIEASQILNIYKGTLYIGVDASEKTIKNPLNGSLDFSNFFVSTSNTEITQWFEQTPVGAENTFIIKSDMDIELVSTEFFEKFSNFIRNYVYPTLEAFTANLRFKSSLSFIPYSRQKIVYNAFADLVETNYFLVKENKDSVEATEPFIVKTNESYKVLER